MSLSDEIAGADVRKGSVRAWWLGGTGFVFKTPAATQVYVDPYLSNAASAIFGLERGFPPPIDPRDARPDLVISTHWHEDHLDPGGLPVIAAHSQSAFMCPPSAVSRLLSWGVPRDRVRPLESGQALDFRDVHIRAVPARHESGIRGWETPDAIGLLFECDGVRIYHSGDTEYDVRLRALAREEIHAAMLVINGATGNMNAHEAALLGWHLRARAVMPMHHILWKEFPPESTLDPHLFASTYRRLGGTGEPWLPRVGEGFTVTSAGVARG